MADAILVAAAALLGISWWVIARKKKKSRLRASDAMLVDAAATSKPLLTESELAFYNLLQMAVQDYYLVFAQVPIWAFVSLESPGQNRIRLVKHMALKRVDFALMHPGSRCIEQVVQIEEESPTPDEEDRQRIVESIVGSASIKLVKVQSKKSYAIPELVALLGLAADE